MKYLVPTIMLLCFSACGKEEPISAIDEFNQGKQLAAAERSALYEEFVALAEGEPRRTSNEIDSLEASIWSEIGEIDSLRVVAMWDFASTNTDTEFGMTQLYNVKNKYPKEDIKEVYEKYPVEVRESEFGVIVSRFLAVQSVAIGDKYKDFVLPDDEDQDLVLTELLDSTYTILYFTAAHCGPCKDANVELSELPQDHVQVISISGDQTRQEWLTYLDSLDVSWATKVWAEKGVGSDVFLEYEITGFPGFVVLDREGYVVSKWLGYGHGIINRDLKENGILPM